MEDQPLSVQWPPTTLSMDYQVRRQPEYGQARFANDFWDFDATDTDVFTIFTDWTRKFKSSCTTEAPPFSDTQLAVMAFLTPLYLGFDYNPIALM